MKLTNIKWDIDIDDVSSILDGMSSKTAAEFLSCPHYADMNDSERLDYAMDEYKSNPTIFYEQLSLPTEVEIPDGLSEEEASDFISDEYGFCHNGFEINEEMER